MLATCPVLTLQHGSIVYTGFAVNGRLPEGTVLSLNCQAGFSRSGPESRKCQSSKTWSGQQTTCIASK